MGFEGCIQLQAVYYKLYRVGRFIGCLYDCIYTGRVGFKGCVLLQALYYILYRAGGVFRPMTVLMPICTADGAGGATCLPIHSLTVQRSNSGYYLRQRGPKWAPFDHQNYFYILKIDNSLTI